MDHVIKTLKFQSTAASFIINSQLSHRCIIGGPERWTSAVCGEGGGGGDWGCTHHTHLPMGLCTALVYTLTALVV